MLKFSKNEAALLRLFFSNTGREFYIQEIGRQLGIKPGIFQRTLYDLERMGILLSRYQAHARFFRANESHPLFQELKSIIFKTIGVMDSLKKLLEEIGHIDFAFIYGSYAKGRENPTSDIDMMIIGAPDESLILQRLDALERALGREINYRILASLDIVRGMRAGEPFLARVLEDGKIFLIGDEHGLRALVAGSSDQEGGA
jgi:predicted nucleotidyltransferase